MSKSLRGWLQSIVGDVAHDAADDGYPVKIGGKAYTSTPTQVANGDRVNAYFDDYGRMHVAVDTMVADVDLDFEAVDLAAAMGTSLTPNGTQADQSLTVDATAGGVQFAAFHADTTHVVLDVQTADVMCTFDNSAPTSTNGHRLYVGDQYVWVKARAVAAKFIRISAVSGLVQASQMKGS